MAAVISRTAQKTPRFRNILKSTTLPSGSLYHTLSPKPSWSTFGSRSMSTDTVPPEVKSNPSSPTSHAPRKAYPNFSLQDRVYVITGGGRGLGLVLAEAIAQAGAAAHCFDRLPEPDPEFLLAQEDAQHHKGSLHYHHVDVRIADELDQTTAAIVSQHGRLDGLVAAAGVQQLKEAVNYTSKDVTEMLDVNYTGVFMSANAVARQMIARKHGGSIVLVASMSGIVANKGLNSPVYNSSKAAVIQLARNLAMEWGKHGIRVNALCPGHIVTPMVQKNFEEVPGLRETWESENMLGRLASPEEFTGATVFLLSDSSSFMTGSSLVLDGGHTAW